MLVIRRRPGEALLIGGDVEIEVLDATPSQVKLGIRAPRSISVLRKEIHLTSEQNRAAAREIPAAAMDAAVEALRDSLRKSPLKSPLPGPISSA
ncbi:MAG TPA: carbon storage regulator [Bryobacteraceae bacterium]